MITFVDQESFLKSKHAATQIHHLQQNMQVHRSVQESFPKDPITKYFIKISINGICQSTPVFPMYSISFN
jgi:hypothetical protein